jgi:predicted ATPase
MVQFFRDQCTEKGHQIWLNTHSQTLVSQLKAEEVILVDKKDGATIVKQFHQDDLHGLSMDEAWLTNALGGGLPW